MAGRRGNLAVLENDGGKLVFGDELCLLNWRLVELDKQIVKI
jgi:hypothetical protein